MIRTGLRPLGTVLTALVVGCAAAMGGGCASFGPDTPVAVSDIGTVTGTWKGIVYRKSEFAPDYVTLTIREDGSYDVASAQGSIGTSRGRGKIVISEGRLIIEGEKGHGVGRLLRDPAGNLTMEVDATMSDNSTLSAKLTRSN
jgi:hypothetical protein